MKLISEPIDMYGQNIYNGWMVKMGEDGNSQAAWLCTQGCLGEFAGRVYNL